MFVFFFTDPATTDIYPLSLHDALPIYVCRHRGAVLCRTAEGNAQSFQCFYHAWTYDNRGALTGVPDEAGYGPGFEDRKSTRLNSSHLGISYAVFCLKKKKNNNNTTHA